jgi:uncharacterized protein (UPF0210 family)
VIRSLTIGLPIDAMSTSEIEAQVRNLVSTARRALDDLDLPVRTLRFTLPAVGADGEAEGALLPHMRWVDGLAQATGVRWFCLPIDLVSAGPRRERLAAVLDGVSRFDRMFVNLIAAADGRIAVGAIDDIARFVLDVSRKTNNGFDNFRVGASFNCPANAPFFPFSRHGGPDVAFSFAVETTRLALETIEGIDRRDIARVRDSIAEALAPLLSRVDAAGAALADATGTRYVGLDASFAPMPVDGISVAALVESLIGASIGSHASVFATSFLTDALRTALARSGARAVGFNGVMYSILEDRKLASASSQRSVNLDSLLALSTVCACGLDMIPVPGASFPEEIAALALDVGALSSALDKPLGIRVLPIPNAHANDYTRLNLDFLCDSRVLGLTANERSVASSASVVGFITPRR